MKNFKLTFSIFVLCIFVFLALGSEDSSSSSSTNSSSSTTSKNYSSSDLVGKSFNPDGWHTVTLKTNSSYRVVQNYSCGGSGTWSVTGNIIKLNYNDSRCESTRNLPGSYKISSVSGSTISVSKQ